MIKAMYSNVDLSPMIESVVADPDAPISAEALAAAQAKGRDRAVATLTKSDEAALLKLADKIGMQKMQTVGDAVQKLSLEMANESDPALQERVGKLVGEAMERFMKERDAKR
jgi:hypothetical protein